MSFTNDIKLTFEAGKSLTLGLDYKIDFINEDEEEDEDKSKEKFLEFKLATVIRDEVEKNIHFIYS